MGEGKLETGKPSSVGIFAMTRLASGGPATVYMSTELTVDVPTVESRPLHNVY